MKHFHILDAVIGFVAFPVLLVAYFAARVAYEDFLEERDRAKAGCIFLDCADPVMRGVNTCKGHYKTDTEPFLLRPPYGNNAWEADEHRKLRDAWHAEHDKR